MPVGRDPYATDGWGGSQPSTGERRQSTTGEYRQQDEYHSPTRPGDERSGGWPTGDLSATGEMRLTHGWPTGEMSTALSQPLDHSWDAASRALLDSPEWSGAEGRESTPEQAERHAVQADGFGLRGAPAAAGELAPPAKPAWNPAWNAMSGPIQLAAMHSRGHKIRLLIIIGLVLALGGAGGYLVESRKHTGAPSAGTANGSSPRAVDPAPAASAPTSGPNTFGYAGGTGNVLGGAGTAKKIHVAVENGIGQDPVAFDALAEQVLGDPRGWTAGKDVTFQRVPQATAADFTIFLASQATAEKLCGAGGIHTDQYLSCSLPGSVIINLTRWLGSIPNYGAPLVTYQAYALNHEVGRQLGHNNESCPGAGDLAPVMQQQTLGLRGCKANAWPYINGNKYDGPPLP